MRNSDEGGCVGLDQRGRNVKAEVRRDVQVDDAEELCWTEYPRGKDGPKEFKMPKIPKLLTANNISKDELQPEKSGSIDERGEKGKKVFSFHYGVIYYYRMCEVEMLLRCGARMTAGRRSSWRSRGSCGGKR